MSDLWQSKCGISTSVGYPRTELSASIQQVVRECDISMSCTFAAHCRALTDSLENANVIPKKQHKTSWNRHRRRSFVDDQITPPACKQRSDPRNRRSGFRM